MARARVVLDDAFPIVGASHADVKRYYVSEKQLLVDDLPLVSPEKFIGYKGNPKAPSSILLKNKTLKKQNSSQEDITQTILKNLLLRF